MNYFSISIALKICSCRIISNIPWSTQDVNVAMEQVQPQRVIQDRQQVLQPTLELQSQLLQKLQHQAVGVICFFESLQVSSYKSD